MDKLFTLLELQRQALDAPDRPALLHVIVNETHKLIPYMQAVFWNADGLSLKLEKISGNAILDEDGNYASSLKVVLRDEIKSAGSSTVILLSEEKHKTLGAALFFRTNNEGLLGGLWLENAAPYSDAEFHILEELAASYAQSLALWSLRRKSVFFNALNRHRRLKWLAVASLVALALFPVRLGVTAPAEIIARESEIITAPFDGMIEKINVEPGDSVTPGDLLITMEHQSLQAQMDMAQQEMITVESALSRAQRESLSQPDKKPNLTALQEEIAAKKIAYDYASDLKNRSLIKAGRGGVAVFSDANALRGRPVRTGDKLMMVANPADYELLIRVPADAMVPFDKNARVTFFLNVSPLSGRQALIRSIGYQASPDPDGLLTYKILAGLPALEKDMRIGWKGTAKIKGDWTVLSYGGPAQAIGIAPKSARVLTMETLDFNLPSLSPNLRLTRAPGDEGESFWTLHDPVANTYFKINWLAFECLARFSACRTAQSLKDVVERETTLNVNLGEIADIVSFLHANSLTALKDQKIRPGQKPLSWWKKIFHGYLYFTVPLFQPQSFLKKTYPKIAVLFSRGFLTAMIGFLVFMALLTLPRMDEFFNTFHHLLSFEGAIAAFIVLAFVKVVHEMAHAYTATRYGIDVPHMGFAFIVLCPVLYTETTGSWQLSSRRARFHIGMAGVMAELCLAGIFLGLWHISYPGSILQTASFIVVCVSLVSSLLVNLNPLMRFDGYYMFSDITGLDNLQARACAFARWQLRKSLFDLDDAPPEMIDPARKRILIFFGAALIVYRFFLFSGIAFLVYRMFFQPLGFALMMVELGFFILKPIASELHVWWRRREDIVSRRRSLVPASVVLSILLLLVIPWKGTIDLPAVLHAADQTTLYAPDAAKIMSLNVAEGQSVEKGEKLAELQSPELETKIAAAKQDLAKLETLRLRAQSNPALLHDETISEESVNKARLKLHLMEEQKNRLTITAPFAGIIRDMNNDVQAGRFISPREPFFTLIDPSRQIVTAYATETDHDRLKPGAKAFFQAGNLFTDEKQAEVFSIAATGEDDISWLELSSVYGGPVAADRDPQGQVQTRRSVYEIHANLVQSSPIISVQRGYLKIKTERKSVFSQWINALAVLLRREAKLG